MKTLLHITKGYLGENTTIFPKIPNNYFTSLGFENSSVPRISCATTIYNCLSSLHDIKDGDILYVYQTTTQRGEKVVFPHELKSKNLVPDAHLTGEYWLLNEKEFHLVEKIKVKEPKGEGLGISKGIPYIYGVNEKGKELFGEHWFWEYHKI